MKYVVIISKTLSHNKGYTTYDERFTVPVNNIEAGHACVSRYANGQYRHLWNTSSQYEGPLGEILDCDTGQPIKNVTELLHGERDD